MPYPGYFEPVYWSKPLSKCRPRSIPARLPLMLQPSRPGLAFGYGPGAIEPLLEFFRAGHTIGGPGGTEFRGVLASRFPTLAEVYGSGAPLTAGATGIAGSPVGRPPGILGERFR